jgi:hypothetical protein
MTYKLTKIWFIYAKLIKYLLIKTLEVAKVLMFILAHANNKAWVP